jgi:hypothetical protein
MLINFQADKKTGIQLMLPVKRVGIEQYYFYDYVGIDLS